MRTCWNSSIWGARLFTEQELPERMTVSYCASSSAFGTSFLRTLKDLHESPGLQKMPASSPSRWILGLSLSWLRMDELKLMMAIFLLRGREDGEMVSLSRFMAEFTASFYQTPSALAFISKTPLFSTTLKASSSKRPTRTTSSPLARMLPSQTRPNRQSHQASKQEGSNWASLAQEEDFFLRRGVKPGGTRPRRVLRYSARVRTNDLEEWSLEVRGELRRASLLLLVKAILDWMQSCGSMTVFLLLFVDYIELIYYLLSGPSHINREPLLHQVKIYHLPTITPNGAQRVPARVGLQKRKNNALFLVYIRIMIQGLVLAQLSQIKGAGMNHQIRQSFLKAIVGLRSATLPRDTITGRPCGQLKGASILYRLSSSPRISKRRSLSPTLMALWQAKLAIKLRQLLEQEFSSPSRSLQSLSTRKRKSSSFSSFPYTSGAQVILSTVSSAFLRTSSNFHPSLAISGCLSTRVERQQLGRQQLQSTLAVYFLVGLIMYWRKRDFSEAACWSTRQRQPSKWMRMKPFSKLPMMSQIEKTFRWKTESLVSSLTISSVSSVVSFSLQQSDIYSGN